MTRDETAACYRAYIDCLNRQDWDGLHRHVGAEVVYNGRRIGLDGYRAMLVEDFRAIPDLRFEIALLLCEPARVAARLDFECTPVGQLFGLPVNGRRVRFSENVFYELEDGRITRVWSVIDKAAVAGQLGGERPASSF